ncbi:hypothetical protein L7F22_000432 [Adiantum nelumboides]|nr:hypothetical protein [Adiantum nelumboides]
MPCSVLGIAPLRTWNRDGEACLVLGMRAACHGALIHVARLDSVAWGERREGGGCGCAEAEVTGVGRRGFKVRATAGRGGQGGRVSLSLSLSLYIYRRGCRRGGGRGHRGDKGWAELGWVAHRAEERRPTRAV